MAQHSCRCISSATRTSRRASARGRTTICLGKCHNHFMAAHHRTSSLGLVPTKSCSLLCRCECTPNPRPRTAHQIVFLVKRHAFNSTTTASAHPSQQAAPSVGSRACSLLAPPECSWTECRDVHTAQAVGKCKYVELFDSTIADAKAVD